MLNRIIIPVLFILLWSSGYIFVEKGLQDNDPLTFLTIRLGLAWFTVFIIFLVQGAKWPKSMNEWLHMAVAGVFLQVVYLGFFFIALAQNMPAGILAIILGAQPIAIALLYRESLTLAQNTGLFIGLLGLALTVSDSLFTGSITTLGIIAAFMALAGISIGTILQKKYCSHVPLSTNMMVQFLVSAIILAFVYFCCTTAPLKWTINFAIALSWVTFVMSVGAFFLFYFLLQKGKAARVTSLLYCVPPVTATMDYLVLHHELPLTSIIGMIIVVLSLILIHKRGSGVKA